MHGTGSLLAAVHMRGNYSRHAPNPYQPASVRYWFLTRLPRRQLAFSCQPVPLNLEAPSALCRRPSSSPARKLYVSCRMASDEDYTAFLNKANQDPGTGASTPTSRPVVSKFVNTDIPQLLLDVKEYYVSDADEPFQPVSLTWKRHTLPSEGML